MNFTNYRFTDNPRKEAMKEDFQIVVLIIFFNRIRVIGGEVDTIIISKVIRRTEQKTPEGNCPE